MDNFKCTEQHLASQYNYKKQIEKELINSLPDNVTTVAQAGKVVRTAASILRLNLLQCALLAWLLRKSNYSLRDLSSSANHISLFEQDQNKQLLLLILLNAYYVKSFLSKQSSPQIDADVLCMIPQFSKIYKSWRPDSLLKDAALSDINLTFNGWTLPPKRPKPDYNQYVNKILELSKTYNVAGNEEEGQPKKKRKVNEPSQHYQSPAREISDQPEPATEKNDMLKSRRSIWLRSSGIDDPFPLPMSIFDYEGDDRAQDDDYFLKKSGKQHSLNYMNFDLQNSKANPPLLNSLFAHSIIQTNSKGIFSSQKNPQGKAKIKQTTSFDEVKE